jgi:lipoprotein-anchoring transpeptidase ErfK/SrfK
MKLLPAFALLAALVCSVLASVSVAAAAPHRSHGQHAAARRASALTADAVNSAIPNGAGNKDPALIVKAEVLLDRDAFSPGAIDGKDGDNFRNALAAFQRANNLATGSIDADTWKALVADNNAPPLTSYTIAQDDVAGPFAKRIPTDLQQMAKLPGLSYKNSQEQLAEKFHMSEALLRKLNPQTHFDRAGEQINVANVQPMPLRPGRDTIEAERPKNQDRARTSVATVVVDKAAHDVLAYDKGGKLVAFYPATIGSTEKPAPSGTFAVQRVAYNPDYHYDPKFAWKGVKTKQPLTVKPGPNNPVGLVWIDLSAPSYGIHGTPEPEKIGKTESHGCIRLTNWDALDLAAMVHRGTVVKFEDKASPAAPLAAE